MRRRRDCGPGIHFDMVSSFNVQILLITLLALSLFAIAGGLLFTAIQFRRAYAIAWMTYSS